MRNILVIRTSLYQRARDSLLLGMAMEHVEKRNIHRTRMLQGGKIVYGRSALLIDCMIRDRTEAGARLKVSNAGEVPETLRLFVTDENSITPARVVWRSEREIGVEFTGDPEKVRDSTDPKIRALRVHA